MSVFKRFMQTSQLVVGGEKFFGCDWNSLGFLYFVWILFCLVSGSLNPKTCEWITSIFQNKEFNVACL